MRDDNDAGHEPERVRLASQEGQHRELFHGFTRRSAWERAICSVGIRGGDMARHYKVIAEQDHIVAEFFRAPGDDGQIVGGSQRPAPW